MKSQSCRIRGGRVRTVVGLLGVFALFVVAAGGVRHVLRAELDRERGDWRKTTLPADQSTGLVTRSGNVTNWWDPVPGSIQSRSARTGPHSNISPADYAGAKSCAKCHQENYEAWSQHPHRWMNALANESTVVGDFSAEANISYLGGEATFFRQGDKFRMRLARDGIVRVFNINQTIGRRFFQYYVGKQVEGPPPSGDEIFYKYDHVLPFGYWIDHEEWIPVVHVGDEMPDGERSDPFAQRQHFADYATRCNVCHTTFPLGDQFIRKGAALGSHAPAMFHFSAIDYLATVHPDLWKSGRPAKDLSQREVNIISDILRGAKAPDHALNLGIGCEACHLGSKAHAEGKLEKPRFFPSSPHLLVEKENHENNELEFGRTHDNVNWVCGRCHTGPRPLFAAGMATWNSTEYKDAMQGSCYSQLRCVDCHNPHTATGKEWSRTPVQDDASCLKCHEKLEPDEARVAHTHHPLESEGSRCMNCHMPRINEGLQDVVRTHTIFSPTNAKMIEANQPNACNQCHVDRPINWTLAYLKDWYGATYPEEKIAANYTDRDRPAALGWLQSPHESVRMIATDSLIRQQADWALPELIGALDDRFLLNRQFAQRSVEKMLDVRLRDFDYRFYMTPEERSGVLTGLREALLKQRDEAAEPVTGDARQAEEAANPSANAATQDAAGNREQQ